MQGTDKPEAEESRLEQFFSELGRRNVIRAGVLYVGATLLLLKSVQTKVVRLFGGAAYRDGQLSRLRLPKQERPPRGGLSLSTFAVQPQM